MAKELDAVHEEFEEREVQMAALTKALSEAGLGLRYVRISPRKTYKLRYTPWLAYQRNVNLRSMSVVAGA